MGKTTYIRHEVIDFIHLNYLLKKPSLPHMLIAFSITFAQLLSRLASENKYNSDMLKLEVPLPTSVSSSVLSLLDHN